MIGVIANASQYSVISEFFELFKVPWELYRQGQRYEVILCTVDDVPTDDAGLILIYASEELKYDSRAQIEVATKQKDCVLIFQGKRIPLYGDCVCFPTHDGCLVSEEESGQPVTYERHDRHQTVIRIGYDLCHEIRYLLTSGQPAAHAAIPTLDLHVALLRYVIVINGIPLVEIPPFPHGFPFIACLTHDVDHPSIRRHKWDQTAAGFVYRAVVGSFIEMLRGRAPFRKLLTNWVAVLKLPFAHLGLANDFWQQAFNRYLEVEDGLRSSFFFIPVKDYPGRIGDDQAPSHRAAAYAASELTDEIETLRLAGCEIGLHGIDAWMDSAIGGEELQEIRRITGKQQVGVRMHWLYFDEQSAGTLDRAGADYDSTVGYNETVGYRAGTTQVYKPFQAERMLELPLHVMDTALFFPGYLDCSLREADFLVKTIVDNAVKCGGVVTVNWHDRSLAPERLWDECYVDLVNLLKSNKAWFATATETVSWFRKRRATKFEEVKWESGMLHAKIVVQEDNYLPHLRLRLHRGSEEHQDFVIRAAEGQPVTDVCEKSIVGSCVAV